MLAARPDLAEVQAREILTVAPGHPEAVLLLGQAVGGQGRLGEALALLEPLAASQPRWSMAHLELGRARGEAGDGSGALAALQTAVTLKPDLAEAWRLLAEQHRLAGDTRAAEAAVARHLAASTQDPQLLAAAAALVEGKLAVAEHALRDLLRERPDEVAALRMLAEVATRLARYENAETLLARALELAPEFAAARMNYAVVLYRQTKAAAAAEQAERLLAGDPRNPGYRNLLAAALGQLGEYQRTIEIYQALLADFPAQPKAWMSLGHALKTVGRQADAIAAYRRSLALAPQLGETWWSLANLKTWRFEPADLAAMRAALGRTDLGDEDRFHLEFALGKALEDAGEAQAAFEAYARGNARRRETLDYDPEETHAHLARSKALFTPGFFAARSGQGHDAPDPIFVVGLPRSGSTLVEQILASHSLVEGTMELPDLPAMAKRLGARSRRDDPSAYPQVLADLDPDALKALGEEYLERTRRQRKTDRPFFIDKMPNNFSHVGLIHLILPNAKIIDARRHPLGCCFSGFKQHFARGQAFTYDLTDLGRYYADYVALMAHFDAVLPGRVHRVIYEAMVADPEGEVRALLAACGLDYEPGCLAFHENDRAVRTASSEQVRRPIFTEGVDQWRKFEPWLGPLKTALGPVLEAYPEAPDFDA
ncbi:sulfotransferase [Phenylobacterium sp.]|uniref:sulfotransferase n=1 Tax=Phenylobacterium sp. TaxID=1871053 RepID=UPI003BAD1CD7